MAQCETGRGLTRTASPQVLQWCALRFQGGSAAHIRVFQPQWAYWAPDAASSLAHARRRAEAGAFFVGQTEAFDESLVLFARWLGLPLADMRYASKKRLYGGGHPGVRDWEPAAIGQLAAAARAAGEAAWHDGMRALYGAQAASYDGKNILEADTAALRALNAVPLTDVERAAERALRLRDATRRHARRMR